MGSRRCGVIILVAIALLIDPRVMAGDTDLQETRPNIVWIMSEDNSKHYLKHFDAAGVATPNIEAMAKHGVTFDRAFSCAPVCSVARTTLITGCYAPRIGTQFHRRSRPAAMPPGLAMFPVYLRQAGYFTTNNSKEDYNADKTSAPNELGPWDNSSPRAHWKARPSRTMPFFHVVTFTDSHESSLHVDVERPENEPTSDISAVRIPPYLPDTPLVRKTYARYLDRIQLIDQRVGNVLQELDEQGELERTFVFYFGDHGGVLPRSKGYLYEAGLHVPLVVRVPEQFQTLAGRELGTRSEGFLEFVDFGPTVLAIAGVKIPQGVDGSAWMGHSVDASEVDSRQEAFAYADRFDEKYEMVRSLREGQWKYIRSFEPHIPDSLQNNYRYHQPAYQQWREMYQAGKLNETQSAFFKAKTNELLFDLESDPHETNNLAHDPAHTPTLLRLRNRLVERQRAMPDLSLFPESILCEQAMESPVAFGQTHRERIGRLLDTANLALDAWDNVSGKLRESLASEDPWQRYWALVVCSGFGKQAIPLVKDIRSQLDHEEPLVRARAAECLALIADIDPREELYRAVGDASTETEALQILNMLAVMESLEGRDYKTDVDKLKFRFRIVPKGEIQNRLNYFSGAKLTR